MALLDLLGLKEYKVLLGQLDKTGLMDKTDRMD